MYKVMVRQKTQQRRRLQIQAGNNRMEQVNGYEYLDGLITENGKSAKAIKAKG